MLRSEMAAGWHFEVDIPWSFWPKCLKLETRLLIRDRWSGTGPVGLFWSRIFSRIWICVQNLDFRISSGRKQPLFRKLRIVQGWAQMMVFWWPKSKFDNPISVLGWARTNLNCEKNIWSGSPLDFGQWEGKYVPYHNIKQQFEIWPERASGHSPWLFFSPPFYFK